MTSYKGLTFAAAEEMPLAKAFVFMQCVHRRHGAELAAPDSAEAELIAELEAEKAQRQRKHTCRT